MRSLSRSHNCTIRKVFCPKFIADPVHGRIFMYDQKQDHFDDWLGNFDAKQVLVADMDGHNMKKLMNWKLDGRVSSFDVVYEPQFLCVTDSKQRNIECRNETHLNHYGFSEVTVIQATFRIGQSYPTVT